MNYYDILGISKTATADEIKRAYRKLASLHHPDRGGETAKFQEIQLAYDTLSDADKKSQYDNPVSHHANFGNGAEFGDIFGNFFHNGPNPFRHARQQPRRNRNIQAQINMGLQETLDNCKKTLSIKTDNNRIREIDVVIPRGIISGNTVRYPGLGDTLFENLPPGDLMLTINVLPNPNYEAQGLDLITTLTLDCFDAILGSEQTVVGLDGKVFVIKVPAGCQNGTKLKIPNEGLWQFQNEARGSLFARLFVTVPKNLTEEQLRLVRIIKNN